MQVQQFLRSGGTLADLLNRYAIKATRSIRHPNLVLLKYNQIDSPMVEPIVQECRGLILDEADDWRVVSCSFRKFFNHGEGHAALIDWNTATVQEKLDGSLCVLYHYKGEWLVQTSGHPDAAGKVGGEGFTFVDLFWQTFRSHGYALPGEKHICVAFELTSKWNRVVVQHAEPRLTMIGIRDCRTGLESSVRALAHVYTSVRSFPLNSFDDAIATFSTMEPLKQEGYVVVDAKFNRVKVKHPGYVAIHHLRDGCSLRRLVEIVQAGEVGEFLTYFPEWAIEFQRIDNGITVLVTELEAIYAQIKSITVQKDFALEAVKTRCSAALFVLRSGKAASIRDYLRKMPADKLLQLIGIKDQSLDPNA